jgi:DNA (cytosine-5)-methyltransferase 1
MKLGGLFSGIGGFELAWTQLGHEVAWMCEIDKSARKVLEARFPGVPIYEDVEQLDPDDVEAVDVLTGGSPCQGFSVAGTRSGLEHGESRLFADYIRIMDGLSERGLQWALWENVPGVLSIQNDDGEMTYEHVVAALVGTTVPVRLGQGRWNTGLADGGGRAVAWRVLDSRYFGVAQRRRRVFACVAFGSVAADRAGRALLAKPEGVSGDSASGGSEGQGVAGGVADGSGGASVAYGMIGGSGSEGATAEEQPSLTASHGQPGNVAQAFNWQSGGDARGLDLTDEPSALTTQQTPAVLLTMREGAPGGGKGPLLVEEESLTLATGNGQTLFQPEPWGFSAGNSENARSMGEEQGVAPPIRAGASGTNQAPTVGPVAFRKAARAQSVEDDESWVADGQANTLNTFDMGNTRTTHAIVEPVAFTQNQRDEVRLLGDTAGALAAGGGMHQTNYVSHYGVRRLTPVEYERLQAFPDGWTEPAGSDSARYKALGNAVTVNTVRWVLGRMLEQS